MVPRDENSDRQLPQSVIDKLSAAAARVRLLILSSASLWWLRSRILQQLTITDWTGE